MLRSVILALFLAGCTDAELRRASDIADKGCSVVMVLKPDSEVGVVCRKLGLG